MDDFLTTLKQQFDLIRANERARIIDALQGALDALRAELPESIKQEARPSTIAEPARPKRGRKAKSISAGAADMAQVEAAVLNGLKRWSEPQRPNAGELASFIGVGSSFVSKALTKLESRGEVKHTGERRGKRYVIPIAASRNSDHAEA